MGLADEIKLHADQANADLNETFNFYDDTRSVWRIFERIVKQGETFTFNYSATNTQVDQTHVLSLMQHYSDKFLAVFTFQRFIAIFETFTFNFLRSIIVAYPGRLAEKELKFKTVLAAADLPALIARVIENELNQLKYEKPSEWFAYLDGIAKLGCPNADQIAKIAEMKACRDILEHNMGIVNAVYLNKAGKEARFKEGDKIEISNVYHRDSWELLKKVISGMAEAGIDKYSKI